MTPTIRINRVLGFDYGSVNIGVATGNSKRNTSSPLCVVRAKSGIPHWQTIDTLVRDWQPDACIVGIPLNADGSEGQATDMVKAFADVLQARFMLPVYLCNERFTTKAAHSLVQEYQIFTDHSLHKKGKRGNEHYDAIAAALIVQQWLDAQVVQQRETP